MPMTPAVANARRKHKAIEATKMTLTLAAFLAFVVVTLWGVVGNAWKLWEEYQADNEFRATLVAASKKSPAHAFLVTNWLQCSPLLQSRAECFSAIRGAAASRGEEFVHQVDMAAKELNLI